MKIQAFHLPYKPCAASIVADWKARKRHKIKTESLVFTEKRDKKLARESRPKLKLFMANMIAVYVKEHGFTPNNRQLKLWKEQYRAIYHIKSCYRDSHNMARTNTESKRKPKIMTKPNKTPEDERIMFNLQRDYAKDAALIMKIADKRKEDALQEIMDNMGEEL